MTAPNPERTERTVTGSPSALPTMLKAALPVLPGVNLLPGVAKKGGALPDLRARVGRRSGPACGR